MTRTLLLLSIVGLSGMEERILAFLSTNGGGMKIIERVNGEGFECTAHGKYETHVPQNSARASVECSCMVYVDLGLTF